MHRATILYRLVDPHTKYGSAGRSYTAEEWKTFPWFHRALFEPVNTELTDYTLEERSINELTEYYLHDKG